MSNWLPRSTTAHSLIVALLVTMLAPLTLVAGAAEQAGAQASDGSGGESAAPEGISEADKHYREGLSLYSRDMYREALNAFNRALALDPNHENAQKMVVKSEAKIQMAASGESPSTVESFDVFDPESIAGESEGGVPDNAESLKYTRTKELMEQGQYYLENKKFSKAQQYFEQILLIDPANKTATRLLAEATVGAYKEELQDHWQQLNIDAQKIRTATEQTKRLPEGADAKGIKDPQISVPVEEEEYAIEREKTDVELALDSPVSIEFDDEHITRITEFVAEYVGINIVVDARVVLPPRQATPTTAGFPGAPGTPTPFPGAVTPGAGTGTGLPGGLPTGAFPAPGGVTGSPFGSAFPQNQGLGFQQFGLEQEFTGEEVTDGYVPYIKLEDVPLSDALKALLRPLNLSYSVQPGFLWISTAEKIRTESFEELETRIYELRNAGAETLFKIVVRNPGGQGGQNFGIGGQGGGFGGGGQGGFGGGGFGGQGGFGGGGQGGFGGGGFGGGGGNFGGGGFGGGGGNFGGGGFGGGQGGFGGGGYGGGGGGYGGGGGGYGGGGGGYGGGGYGGGGGGYGGGGGRQFSNISDLFGTISDEQVGETPAVIGLSASGTGLSSGALGGTTGGRRTGGITGGGGLGGRTGGTTGGGRFGGGDDYGGGLGGGLQGQTGQGGTGGLGGAAGLGGFQGQAEVLTILENAIPPVIEPYTGEVLSWMVYNPAINQLLVHSTPTYLNTLEELISNLDVTPKQVSIESKFVTISVTDLDKIGFTWDISLSNQNDRARQISTLEDAERSYDVDGDGVLESIPFYSKPDGSQVIDNSVLSGVINAAANPGPAGTTSIATTLLNNSDGDMVGVTMDYLNSLTDTELLSAPRVTTMNRKPAVIADILTQTFNTQVISTLQTSDAGFGGTPTTAAQQQLLFTEFFFGITLSVTPQITGGNQVRLWLNPQVTTQQGVDEFVQRSVIDGDTLEAEISFPRTSVQSVWTNVIVNDGDTLVLGGLITDRTTKGQERLPYLSEIPVIGFLFRGKSVEINQSSLLIFVTVDIIDPTGARFFEAAS